MEEGSGIRCCFCHMKGAKRMQKRKLEDLNLIDDFLFFTMLNDEVIGEDFGRYLLEIIFDRKFGKLKVVPQKVYYGVDTDKHGVRLDVYLEEEIDSETLLEKSSIYDLEVESKEKDQEEDNLPKRVRFYHSRMDVNCLGSGKDYRELKKVIVVMIMPYDPFGCDHMIYTICNKCLEVPELPYDDGARTLFLYTKGTKGNPSERLRELLHYMEDSKQENVKNDGLRAIHSMVKVVKRNPGVSKEYMKIFEKERMIREKGQKEGLKEGALGAIRMALSFGKDKSEVKSAVFEQFHISEIEFEELYEKAIK